MTIPPQYLVAHNIASDHGMDEPHFHDGYEIFLALSDQMQFFVNNKVYSLSHGDLLVFNNTDLHRALMPEGAECERYYLIFQPQYVEDFFRGQTNLLSFFHHNKKQDHYCAHLSAGQTQELVGLFQDCLFYYETTDSIYALDLLQKLSVIKILLLVGSCYADDSNFKDSLQTGQFKRMRKIQRYILDHLAEDLPVDRLAKEFFLSKWYLQRLFKQYCGFSVKEYIISVKIMRAKELLEQGLPVSAVGTMIGYPNASHFSRIFKLHTGVSPKKYAHR